MKINRYISYALLILVAILFLQNNADARSGFGEKIKRIFSVRKQAEYGPGDHDFSLIHDGIKRIYKVHVPVDYNRNNPVAILIAFHGGGGNALGSIGFFKLDGKADKENFIVVYPEGSGKKVSGKMFASWNAGECCPQASEKNIDDVGFVSQMMDKLFTDFSIDAKKVYAVGFSNGALMCYRLACELSEKIAAIAVGGAQDAFKNCNPKTPVAVLHFHGTSDKCAIYEGGVCGGCFADYLNKISLPVSRNNSLWNCRSVPEYIKEWSILNGCTDQGEVVYEKESAKCFSYNQCRHKVEVVLCTLEGSGHTWPGGSYGNKICEQNKNSFLCSEWINTVGEVNKDLSANDMLWEFFKRHPRN